MTEWYKWFSDKFNKLLTEQKVFESVVDTNFGEGQIIIRNLQSGIAFDVRKTLLTGGMGEEILRGSLKSIFKDTDSMDVKVKKIAQWVNTRLTYISDQKNYAKPEYWADAYTVYDRKKDDCLTGDTEVITIENNIYHIKRLDEIQVGDYVLSYNEKTSMFEPKKVINFWNKGIKPIIQLKTRNGNRIKCTANHKFYRIIKNKLKTDKVENFINNSNGNKFIAQPIKLPTLNHQLDADHDDMFIIGQYLSEGWTSITNRVYISGDDPQMQDYLESLFIKKNIAYTKSKRTRNAYFEIRCSKYKEFLKQFGRKSTVKDIPDEFLSLSKDLLETMYFSFIIGDGYFDQSDKERLYGWCTTSDKLMKKLRLISYLIGQPVTISYKKNHGGFGKNPIWRAEYTPTSSRLKPIKKNLGKISIKKELDLEPEVVYDIEVEDNHNFILANGTLVHNCDGYAVLIMTLMRLAGVPAWRRRIVVGEVDSGEYHAYIVYFSEDSNDWFALEGSYYATEALTNFNNVPYIKNIRYKTPEWCFNEDTAWTINGKEMFISKLK